MFTTQFINNSILLVDVSKAVETINWLTKKNINYVLNMDSRAVAASFRLVDAPTTVIESLNNKFNPAPVPASTPVAVVVEEPATTPAFPAPADDEEWTMEMIEGYSSHPLFPQFSTRISQLGISFVEETLCLDSDPSFQEFLTSQPETEEEMVAVVAVFLIVSAQWDMEVLDAELSIPVVKPFFQAVSESDYLLTVPADKCDAAVSYLNQHGCGFSVDMAMCDRALIAIAQIPANVLAALTRKYGVA